jgi:glycerol-3-phosphate dehydrogenase
LTGGIADVVIIGAGVVGTAIARALSRYELGCVLVDAAGDVGTGTTKANTAILHTGFDAVPGSLESRLLRRGSALLRDYAAQAGIPVERTGALLIAWTPEQEAELPAITEKSRQNGYTAVRPVTRADLYRREPHLRPGALAALEIPDESILCPWTTPLAYATEAVRAGVRLLLGTRVTGVTAADWQPGRSGMGAGARGHVLATSRGELRCRWLVNAAGLESDRIDRMLGGHGFTIRPRRGELIVFDKLARPLIRSILLPVPTAQTKGVLVAPTVYGNVLLGPTAEDIDDPCDTATTAAGLAALRRAGRAIIGDLLEEEVTATYAGLRAATEHRDYQIEVDRQRRYACVAGIRSTGLSASLGIAEYVVERLGAAGLTLRERAGGPAAPPVLPNNGAAGTRPYQDAARIAADPAYGRIVCHCERVTGGEIRDALAGPLPPADIDGLRRRTRVLNGRCQGFFCAATVSGLFAAGRQGGPGVNAGGLAGGQIRRAGVNVDVLVVGAGPAGLAAAIELRRLGIGRVLVVDREQQAGGIPRHSAHTGYGLRDLHRVLTGPAYARHYANAAARAGAEIRTGTTVTGWAGGQPTDLAAGLAAGPAGAHPAVRRVTITSPAGLETIDAAVVLLATGCRERPRPARLIPGDRPPGVLTTGELQQRVYLRGERLPGRALILGAEHVSFSAMVTLAHAGADVVALVTEQPRQQSYAVFPLAAAVRWRVPVWTSTAIRRVTGRGRLAGVELADLRTGATRMVECDTLVLTGDWIPDQELARAAGISIDPGTRGPAVDTALESPVSHIFAAGNLVHAAETADVAALGGRHAARHIAAALRDQPPAGTRQVPARRVPVTAAAPLRWISPNAVRVPLVPPPRGRFLLRSEIFRRHARLEVRQDGRLLATARASLIPARPVHLDAGWLAKVDQSGGPVRVLLG